MPANSHYRNVISVVLTIDSALVRKRSMAKVAAAPAAVGTSSTVTVGHNLLGLNALKGDQHFIYCLEYACLWNSVLKLLSAMIVADLLV